MAVRLFKLSTAKKELCCNVPREIKLETKQNWGTTIFMRRQGQRELQDLQILKVLMNPC